MADSGFAINVGSDITIDTRTEGTNSEHRQVVTIGDPSTNAGVAPVDVTEGLKVYSDTNASSLGKAEDAAHTSGDTGVMALGVRQDSISALGADGDYVPFVVDANGRLYVTAQVGGDQAHDGVDIGLPIKIGGRADSTFQAAASDGDRVDALFDVYGVQEVRTDHPNKWSFHSDGSSALTDQEVEADPGAGLSIYITDIVFSTGAATACNIFFEEGSTKVLGSYYLEATAGRNLTIHFNTPKKITANTALTVTTSAAIAQSLDVTGFLAP